MGAAAEKREGEKKAIVKHEKPPQEKGKHCPVGVTGYQGGRGTCHRV